MSFTPLDDKQIQEQGLLAKNSVYDFEVLESVTFDSNTINLEAKVSSSGNPMIVAPIAIYNENGDKIKTIIDYIVITKKMMWKVRDFCEVTGLMDEYNSGDEQAIAAKAAGKTGKVKIGIRVDKSGEYPDKNVIGSYVSGGGITKKVELDDEIPF